MGRRLFGHRHLHGQHERPRDRYRDIQEGTLTLFGEAYSSKAMANISAMALCAFPRFLSFDATTEMRLAECLTEP